MKELRPTSGRVLSALFSILGGRVTGARFLDMFAGSGRAGLEALKRGASSCVFVESVRARAEEIRRLAGDGLVLGLEVRRAVAWLMKRDMTFNIIFADPPYNSGWCEVITALRGLDVLLEPGGVFVIEHSVREPLSLNENPNMLELISERTYGETCLSFLQRMT